MITLTDVNFAYDRDAPALRGVSGEIPPGALAILAGANGSGKSTLLALLAGIFAPTSGTIAMDGLVSPGDELKLRRCARLVMQDSELQILGATVEEDLLLGGDPGDEDLLRAAKNIARRFEIDDLFDQPVQTLSFGQKRKLCLAGALLPKPGLPAPKVLLLDEPLSGMDYHGMLEMRSILAAGKAGGLTQVVASHDLDPLADMADMITVLHKGRAPLFGTPEDILPNIRDYGVRPPCSWTAGRGLEPWE